MSLADAFKEFDRSADAGLAKFGPLKLTATAVVYEGKAYPLRGLQVAVDTGGNLSHRPTLTRWLAVGPMALAWQKKQDKRTLFLTFESPIFGFLVEVSPDLEYGARTFATKVNAASRALEV